MLHPKYRVKAADKRKVLDIVRKSENAMTTAEVANIANLDNCYTSNLLYLLCKQNRLCRSAYEFNGRTYLVYEKRVEIK